MPIIFCVKENMDRVRLQLLQLTIVTYHGPSFFLQKRGWAQTVPFSQMHDLNLAETQWVGLLLLQLQNLHSLQRRLSRVCPNRARWSSWWIWARTPIVVAHFFWRAVFLKENEEGQGSPIGNRCGFGVCVTTY